MSITTHAILQLPTPLQLLQLLPQCCWSRLNNFAPTMPPFQLMSRIFGCCSNIACAISCTRRVSLFCCFLFGVVCCCLWYIVCCRLLVVGCCWLLSVGVIHSVPIPTAPRPFWLPLLPMSGLFCCGCCCCCNSEGRREELQWRFGAT